MIEYGFMGSRAQTMTLEKLRTTYTLVLFWGWLEFLICWRHDLAFAIIVGNLGGQLPGLSAVLADADLQGSYLVLSGMGMGRMSCLIFCQGMCVLCCGFAGHGSLVGWGATARGAGAQSQSPRRLTQVQVPCH